MQPVIWKPPVELSKQEEQIAKKIRKAKLFVFLREHRHELLDETFQQELASLYRKAERGQPPVSPAVLALALILEAYTGVSDDEVIEATVMDRRDGRLAGGVLSSRYFSFLTGRCVDLERRSCRPGGLAHPQRDMRQLHRFLYHSQELLTQGLHVYLGAQCGAESREGRGCSPLKGTKLIFLSSLNHVILTGQFNHYTMLVSVLTVTLSPPIATRLMRILFLCWLALVLFSISPIFAVPATLINILGIVRVPLWTITACFNISFAGTIGLTGAIGLLLEGVYITGLALIASHWLKRRELLLY